MKNTRGARLATAAGLTVAAAMLCASPSLAQGTDPAPPLSKRTAESGLPMSANQLATGLDTLDLAIRVDPAAATVAARAKYGLTALAPMSRVELDLDPRYAISEVRLNGAPVGKGHWRNADGQLSIDLPARASKGDRLAVEIAYAGKPHIAARAPWEGGIMWRQTATGQPWIATANQGEGCDILWPCIDNPQKRVGVTDIAFTVPAPLVAAGNGKFMGKVENDGWTTWKWQARNLNAYALTLNIGPYELTQRDYTSRYGNSFPLVFYHLPGEGDKPAALLDEMAGGIDFFERTIGPYPFGDEKAGLVETPHLGMEHQTINGYGNGFKLAPEGFDWLMQHEFGHEWFANQLAETEPKHMWLQEGLDSYMQPLLLQKTRGEILYHSYLWDMRKKIVSKVALAPSGSLSSSYYNDREAGWGGDIYYKGAWIAHTLRGLIGDEAFFATLTELVYGRSDPKPGNFAPIYRDTDDFERIASARSGRDLGWFFDAYTHEGALPKLVATPVGNRLDLAWKTESGKAFPMPVEVRVGTKIETVPMTGGRGSVALGSDTTDYLVDPGSKILRDDPAITAWQEAERAKAKAAAGK